MCSKRIFSYAVSFRSFLQRVGLLIDMTGTAAQFLAQGLALNSLDCRKALGFEPTMMLRLFQRVCRTCISIESKMAISADGCCDRLVPQTILDGR